MTMFRRLLHWVFAHPGHEHRYALHVERDLDANVKPYWRCMFLLCGDEIEVTEWN